MDAPRTARLRLDVNISPKVNKRPTTLPVGCEAARHRPVGGVSATPVTSTENRTPENVFLPMRYIESIQPTNTPQEKLQEKRVDVNCNVSIDREKDLGVAIQWLKQELVS